MQSGSASSRTTAIRIIGLGNEFRCDDAVGVRLAERLRKLLPESVDVVIHLGDGATLMDRWTRADYVVLIDAVQSGARPGTIHRLNATRETIPTGFFNYSTHAFSLAEAVEVARTLDRLPPTMIIYGIEGKTFSTGQELSAEVAEAAEQVSSEIVEHIKELLQKN